MPNHFDALGSYNAYNMNKADLMELDRISCIISIAIISSGVFHFTRVNYSSASKFPVKPSQTSTVTLNEIILIE